MDIGQSEEEGEGGMWPEDGYNLAKYIAASNPAAILDLLEENKRLEQERNAAYMLIAGVLDCPEEAMDLNPAELEVLRKANAFVEGENE